VFCSFPFRIPPRAQRERGKGIKEEDGGGSASTFSFFFSRVLFLCSRKMGEDNSERNLSSPLFLFGGLLLRGSQEMRKEGGRSCGTFSFPYSSRQVRPVSFFGIKNRHFSLFLFPPRHLLIWGLRRENSSTFAEQPRIVAFFSPFLFAFFFPSPLPPRCGLLHAAHRGERSPRHSSPFLG